MEARSFEILGRVQGVGFRSYVMDLASDLGITGEVWNRRDGAVELVAFAEDQETLDRMKSRLMAGPGRVDQVLSGIADPSDPPLDFRVSFTR